VINAASGKVVATIRLGGRPEFAVADPTSHHVFCNIEDKSEVAEIDTKRIRLPRAGRWRRAKNQAVLLLIPRITAFSPDAVISCS
jgi:hypothetical protein